MMALETLVCETCDAAWQRKVVRGRKPKECPTCKGEAPTKPQQYDEQANKAKRKVKLYAADLVEADDNGKVFERFELDGYEVKPYTGLVYDGEKYMFRSLVVRDDNTAYCNLVGKSGIYTHKYRSIELDKLELA